MTKRKIGVLVSGRGSNFQAVADKIKKENLPIEIAVVISDSPEAYALQRAEIHRHRRAHQVDGRQHGGNHNLHQNTAAENFFGGVIITLAHAY